MNPRQQQRRQQAQQKQHQQQQRQAGVPTIDELVANTEMVNKDDGPFSNYLDTAKEHQIWQVAVRYANSEAVPKRFQGRPNDCYVGIQLAIRLNLDFLGTLQNLYIVHGNPGISGQLYIALLRMKAFKEVEFEFERTENPKDKNAINGFVSCRAVGITEDGRRIEGPEVTAAMVRSEGWVKNPKWTSMTDLMFRYRTGAFLARTARPEVFLGLYEQSELADIAKADAEFSREVGTVMHDEGQRPRLPPKGNQMAGVKAPSRGELVLQRITRAQSIDELQAIGKELGNGLRSELPELELLGLQRAWSARREALMAPPKDPEPQPKPEQPEAHEDAPEPTKPADLKGEFLAAYKSVFGGSDPEADAVEYFRAQMGADLEGAPDEALKEALEGLAKDAEALANS